MSEQSVSYPANWQIAADFSPNDHMMNLKGKDYLGVQHRLVWFIRDQRALIVAGLATHPYVTRTELVELDRDAGWAHFKTTVRDVLGNESTAYGSESAKDFGDYIEKAATKSLGRALVGLGYGTGMAPEMDEGERVVDSPIERRQPAPTRATATPAAPERPQPTTPPTRPQRPPAPAHSDAGRPTAAPAGEGKANEWVTTDGYNPLNDMELRKRVKAIGITNMADFETFLRAAQDYQTYNHAAINAELTIWEGRHEKAQRALSGASAGVSAAQEG